MILADIRKFIGHFFSVEIQDKLGLLRRYSLFGQKGTSDIQVVARIDGKSFHGGMCDRFKGIVSLYCFCKCRNFNFKIYYTYPFPLTDFLVPNSYNWILNEEDLCKNLFCVKLLRLIGDPTADRLQRLTTSKQIHCYANRDIVSELNKVYQTQFNWGELFAELFKPTDELQNILDYHSAKIGKIYVSVAFRFQNLLGDFKEYSYKPLTSHLQIELIEKCKKSLFRIHEKYHLPLLVTSDSVTFLDALSDLDFVYAIRGKAVHIDSISTKIENEHEVYLKSFVDFYMLAGGVRIVSVGTEQMYKSEFPLCASWLNNIPFERIEI